jgi:2-succinyl-5-enolpyruvyl-6-hydroxy-3-cyclohexene-1-carboxylate synthase
MASHGDVEQVVIDAGRRWKDHQSLAHEMIRACPIDLCERALARWEAEAAPTWAARWMDADRAAAAGALAQPDGTDAHGVHEGRIAADVVQALPADTPLFVSSSMPIRDVDGYGGGTSEPLSVHGNRGASGIDGILSTALGVAAGAGRTGVAIVGDLAFLHDVNGLLAAREADANVVFVLVHNDGGGIFHMLPIRDHEPAFTPYFATPHGAEPAQGAAMYGVTHHRVAAEAVGDAVWDAVSGGETVVLEVRSERESNRAAHRRSEARAMAAVRTALGLD